MISLGIPKNGEKAGPLWCGSAMFPEKTLARKKKDGPDGASCERVGGEKGELEGGIYEIAGHLPSSSDGEPR